MKGTGSQHQRTHEESTNESKMQDELESQRAISRDVTRQVGIQFLEHMTAKDSHLIVFRKTCTSLPSVVWT